MKDAVDDNVAGGGQDQDPPERPAPEEAPVEEGSPSDPPTEAKRLITLAVPPVDRLLVILGAAAMVLAGLLSWINVAPDAFPNFAGIGAGGGGVGLVVFLAGLVLLSGRPRIDTANGVALGGFLASVITVIVLFDDADGTLMGGGAWVAMIGSFVALTGIVFAMTDPARRPARRVDHSVMAALGAGLAIIASFWMDWATGAEGRFAPSAGGMFGEIIVVGGLDSEIATGYPVLILGVLVLLLLLGLLSPSNSAGMQAKMATHVRVGGIAVVVLAGGDLAGSLMGPGLTGSGPILALIGGLMIARSVGPAEDRASETAGVEAA
ncbi:MAG: hypothetical protein OXG52_09160 [bacterium]|nr:hypothetical protein [bacterium]